MQAQICRGWGRCQSERGCLAGAPRRTYHAQVYFNRGGDPEGEGEPGFVVADDQAFPDVVCADRTGDDNDEAEAEEDHDADALLHGHLKPRYDWNG